MTANEANDDDSYCIRGLESFEDEITSQHFLSKKKLYHSTIKMEQIRQGILGIKDPERFRVLVEAQSNLALHRAQDLAAQDAREVNDFLSHPTASEPKDGRQSRKQNPFKSTSASSFSDMKRLRHMMESVYGSPPSSLDYSSNMKNIQTSNHFFKNNASSSSSAVHETGVSSVASDGSTEGASSSSESNTIGQTLFSNESIRELQQRSMRHLMGIYQNNDEEGTEGACGTNSLFKFARKDSLLGIGKNSASRNDTSISNKNSAWAVSKGTSPPEKGQTMDLLHRRQQEQQDHLHQQQQMATSNDATSILQQRVKDLMQHRQLLEYNRQQAEQQQPEQTESTDDANTILRERISELMQQRKQLYDNHQQQEQVESPENDTLSLQDQIKELMQRRKLLEDHIHHQQLQQQQLQQQQHQDASPSLVDHVIEMIQRRNLQQGHHPERTSPVPGTIGPHVGGGGKGNGNNNSNRVMENFLIQQQQRQEEHQKRMQLALMAMSANRFPIRRDTLSHLCTNETSESRRHSLPWNVTSMA